MLIKTCRQETSTYQNERARNAKNRPSAALGGQRAAAQQSGEPAVVSVAPWKRGDALGRAPGSRRGAKHPVAHFADFGPQTVCDSSIPHKTVEGTERTPRAGGAHDKTPDIPQKGAEHQRERNQNRAWQQGEFLKNRSANLRCQKSADIRPDGIAGFGPCNHRDERRVALRSQKQAGFDHTAEQSVFVPVGSCAALSFGQR
ncbi:MAG: hypothetical protein ACI4SV_00345, partial [Duodenibacillus sp.]